MFKILRQIRRTAMLSRLEISKINKKKNPGETVTAVKLLLFV